MNVGKYSVRLNRQVFAVTDVTTITLYRDASGWTGKVECEGDVYATRSADSIETVLSGVIEYLARTADAPGDVRLPVDERKQCMLWARQVIFIKEG